MPKRNARYVSRAAALIVGAAALAAPALATQTDASKATTAPAAKPVSKQASHLEASAKAAPQAPSVSSKSSRGTCANDREMAALNARVVQTELMVAALSCEERQRYNQFATTYQAVLVGRADDMRNFFKRTGGKQGTTRMNALVTRLANDASQLSQMRADSYCQFASELFDEVLRTPPAQFNTITDKPWIQERHGYTACAAATAR